MAFSKSERQRLLNNPNVEKVTASNVRYESRFKISAIKLYNEGMSPREIFINAGIDLSLFEKDYARKSVARWASITAKEGVGALNQERRGINATGRPGHIKFKSQSEEIAYLRAENDFLKKLRALGLKSTNKKSSR